MAVLQTDYRPLNVPRVEAVLFFLLWGVNAVQHVPSFYRQHFLGDENVYIALAVEMHWDGSNYTTMNVPGLRDWPNTIYRQPLFHHGPLVPYVLKVGQCIHAPTTTFFLFVNAVMGLFLIYLRRLMKIMEIPPPWNFLAYVGAATGPLLLFSTTRIHGDALGGLLIASGLIAFVEALQKKSPFVAIWSGVLISLALNSRFNAICVLPVLLGMQLYAILVVYSPAGVAPRNSIVAPGWYRRLVTPSQWGVFAVVVTLVATVGLQHFYRLWLTYGSIYPRSFMTYDASDPYVKAMIDRTHLQMLLAGVVLLPILLAFASRDTYRVVVNGMRRGSWAPAFVFSFLFMFVFVEIFLFRELRYLALVTPLLYCCVPYVIMCSTGWHRLTKLVLAVLTGFSSVWTAYFYLVVAPNQVAWIFPAFYQYLPFLAPLYGPVGLPQ